MKSGYLFLLQCFLALHPSHSMMYGDSHDQAPLDNPGLEQTYLRVVFTDGSQEFFRNWECPDGIWAEEMNLKRTPNCVCVKGVYAIGSALCDEEFQILTGNEHCFSVKDKTVRKFIPLIGKSGFAGRANTVFRKDAPYFARLTSSVPTTSVAEAMHYVFRMNDPYDFSVYAKLDDNSAARLKCFIGQEVAETPAEKPIMQIAKLPNCSNEFRGPKEWCSNMTFGEDYEWTLQIGDSWSPSGASGKGEVYPGSCAQASSGLEGKNINIKGAKKGKNGKKSKGKGKSRPKRWTPKKKGGAKPGKGAKAKVSGKSQTIKPMSPSTFDIPKCDKFDDDVMEAPEYDTLANHFMQIEKLDSDTAPDFHSSSLHQKEVGKQNKRIAHILKSFYMNGTAPPTFRGSFPEYKYILTSKEITKKVCPEDYVPHHVLNVLTGVFRLLYLDSSNSFPYPLEFKEAEHARILDTLNKCKEAALPISFMSENENDTCAEEGELFANQTYNDTTFILFDPKTNLTMPGHASFNFTAVDVSLELVWKMLLLTHYYCAPHFEEHPLDLGEFYIRAEAMFLNPVLQFRWYFPGQFNRLMQYFMLAYDLQRFAKGVDRCVAAAFGGSQYPGWMSRPADLLGYNAGRTKPLSHDIGRSLTKQLEKAERSKRKKRFYLQDDMWKRQGYCMHTTDAPFTEVRTGTFSSCKKKPAWFENIE